MKFAHLSDCHLGAWNNHPDLRELPILAFNKTIDQCIIEQVDFILISGDLFDTSLPAIDILKSAVAKLKECKNNGIEVYVIPGSHDFSPTGKTMISVLDEAGLLKDVSMKLAIEKSGAKLIGIFGRKGGLEKEFFENIPKVEKNGFRIFLFHSAIDEFSTVKQYSIPLKFLPKDFDYYAGGHVHERFHEKFHGKDIVYPGCLFPVSFSELEKSEKYENGFYLVNVAEKVDLEWRKIKVCDVSLIEVNCDGKSAIDVEREINEKIEKSDLNGKIMLLKIHGTLVGDIDIRAFVKKAYDKGAKSVKKSIHIEKKYLEEVRPVMAIEDIEKDLIEKHSGQKFKKEEEMRLISELMLALKEEKGEETQSTFEERLKEDVKKIFNL